MINTNGAGSRAVMPGRYATAERVEIPQACAISRAVMRRVLLRNLFPKGVIPAKAGIYCSAARELEQWVPADAGMASWVRAVSAGAAAAFRPA